MRQVTFQPLFGSLIYTATAVHPDNVYAVSAAAKFCENPGIAHWKALKNIFKYPKGTRTHGLCYSGSTDQLLRVYQLECYTDADYAGVKDKRRSRSGYVLPLNAAAMSWLRKVQTCVAWSTTESERVAASESTKEAVRTPRLFKQLGTNKLYRLPSTVTTRAPSKSSRILNSTTEHNILESRTPKFVLNKRKRIFFSHISAQKIKLLTSLQNH